MINRLPTRLIALARLRIFYRLKVMEVFIQSKKSSFFLKKLDFFYLKFFGLLLLIF